MSKADKLREALRKNNNRLSYVDGPTESATHWIYPITEAFDGCGEMKTRT